MAQRGSRLKSTGAGENYESRSPARVVDVLSSQFSPAAAQANDYRALKEIEGAPPYQGARLSCGTEVLLVGRSRHVGGVEGTPIIVVVVVVVVVEILRTLHVVVRCCRCGTCLLERILCEPRLPLFDRLHRYGLMEAQHA